MVTPRNGLPTSVIGNENARQENLPTTYRLSRIVVTAPPLPPVPEKPAGGRQTGERRSWRGGGARLRTRGNASRSSSGWRFHLEHTQLRDRPRRRVLRRRGLRYLHELRLRRLERDRRVR